MVAWSVMATVFDKHFHDNIEHINLVIRTSGNLRNDLKEKLRSAIDGLTVVFNDMKKEIIKKDKPGPPLIRPTAITREYSSVVRGRERSPKKEPPPSYRVVVKPKTDKTSDETRQFIKQNLDPVKLGVGITRMTSSGDGTIILQSSNRIDSEKIAKEINDSLQASLTAEVGTKFRPRLIVYDIPPEITKETATDVIRKQNKDIVTENSFINTRTVLTNRFNNTRRNLIIEVDSTLRRAILSAGLKLMFSVCRAGDYLYVRRCYKCNRFHPGTQDECRNEITCPQCTGNHDLKSCTATPDTFKCINCVKFNERTRQTRKICHNHSATDKSCPSYINRIDRLKSMIQYDE